MKTNQSIGAFCDILYQHLNTLTYLAYLLTLPGTFPTRLIHCVKHFHAVYGKRRFPRLYQRRNSISSSDRLSILISDVIDCDRPLDPLGLSSPRFATPSVTDADAVV